MKISQASNSLFRTSYSALETFKQCPQKFKFQEIDRIKVPKSKEAVFGIIIHDALKFFHSQYPVSPTLDELLNYYKDSWPASPVGGNSKPFQNEQEDMIYFSEGIRMLKAYHEYYVKNRAKSTVIDTEARFSFTIENQEENKKCTLVGKIDRIDKLANGTIEIIDYKTTKKLPPQHTIDHSLQFSIYCLGLLLRWPHLAERGPENIGLTFHYLRHGEILATKRTKRQLEKAKEEIWEILNEIEKADFKPIPSALCDWCGYKKTCPMWRNLYKEQKSVNDEQIKEIVNEFFALKENNGKNNKRLSELKELIEEYLDREKIERIFSDMGYITRLTQVRYNYDINKIREVLGSLDKWQIEKKYTLLKASIKKKKS